MSRQTYETTYSIIVCPATESSASHQCISCRNRSILDNPVGIQAQMPAVRVGMDIIVARTHEFCINTRGESRVSLECAACHGLFVVNGIRSGGWDTTDHDHQAVGSGCATYTPYTSYKIAQPNRSIHGLPTASGASMLTYSRCQFRWPLALIWLRITWTLKAGWIDGNPDILLK